MTGAAAPPTRAEAADLLGVTQDAPAAEVQRAFLRAARYTHPDTVPEADVAGRAAAGDRFDGLLRARAVLLSDAPADGAAAAPDPTWRPRPGDPDGPRYRPVRGRGLGGSLVVLALLAFLLVALVSLDEGMRGRSFDPPGDAPTSSTAP